MASGVGWMLLLKLCERGIGLVSTIILARLLAPADFGLVAMAMSIVAMVELLRAFSFDTVLIQKQDATHADYDTIWTLNLIFTLAMAAMLVVFARPAALFYEDARLENIIYVVTFAIAISGLENVGVVRFRKDLQFNMEFLFLVTKKLSGLFVSIPIAFALRSYWALVGGIIAMNVGGVILSFALQSHRPTLTLRSAKELIGFSKWLFFNNMLFFLRLRGVDFIVGRMAGAHALGVLTLAFEISSLPTSEVVQSINRALFPGYAKLNKDIALLAENYLRTVSSIALFAFPAGVGLALTAHLVVPIALGPSWLEAIPAIQMLSIYGILVGLQANGGYVILALGKPRILTVLQITSLCVMFPLLIYLTSNFGITGAALGQLLTVVLVTPLNYGVIFRLLRLGLPSLMQAFWRPAAATATMAAACLAAQARLPRSDALEVLGAELGFLVCLGAVVYFAALVIFWRLAGMPAGVESIVLGRIPGLTTVRRELK